MLFYCQILLNFQSAQALIQVRSLSNYIQNHWIATIVYETAVEGTYPPDAE